MTEKPIAAGKSSFDLVDTKRLFSILRLKEDTTFLDVACGSGAYSIAASEHIGQAGRIYAFDLWKEGIDALQREISIRQINNIHARVVDLSKRIPVEDHCVDVCLMATVLHDLIQDKTHEGALREVQRVLKPQGTLAVIEFRKIDGPSGPPMGIRISPEEVEKYLHPYFFRITKTMDIGQYNYLSIFAGQKGI
jgi:ubiquinone/menaquinone biosynthesis C-methylase UbiE